MSSARRIGLISAVYRIQSRVVRRLMELMTAASSPKGPVPCDRVYKNNEAECRVLGRSICRWSINNFASVALCLVVFVPDHAGECDRRPLHAARIGCVSRRVRWKSVGRSPWHRSSSFQQPSCTAQTWFLVKLKQRWETDNMLDIWKTVGVVPIVQTRKSDPGLHS